MLRINMDYEDIFGKTGALRREEENNFFRIIRQQRPDQWPM